MPGKKAPITQQRPVSDSQRALYAALLRLNALFGPSGLHMPPATLAWSESPTPAGCYFGFFSVASLV